MRKVKKAGRKQASLSRTEGFELSATGELKA